MFTYRNTVKIEVLMSMGFVHAGIVSDKHGNQALLASDGRIVLNNHQESFSLHKAASQHLFDISSIVKNVNGWKYWYVENAGERITLDEIRNHVHKVFVVDPIEKLLESV